MKRNQSQPARKEGGNDIPIIERKSDKLIENKTQTNGKNISYSLVLQLFGQCNTETYSRRNRKEICQGVSKVKVIQLVTINVRSVCLAHNSGQYGQKYRNEEASQPFSL